MDARLDQIVERRLREELKALDSLLREGSATLDDMQRWWQVRRQLDRLGGLRTEEEDPTLEEIETAIQSVRYSDTPEKRERARAGFKRRISERLSRNSDGHWN